jgi:hypothetical protein
MNKYSQQMKSQANQTTKKKKGCGCGKKKKKTQSTYNQSFSR